MPFSEYVIISNNLPQNLKRASGLGFQSEDQSQWPRSFRPSWPQWHPHCMIKSTANNIVIRIFKHKVSSPL